MSFKHQARLLTQTICNYREVIYWMSFEWHLFVFKMRGNFNSYMVPTDHSHSLGVGAGTVPVVGP